MKMDKNNKVLNRVKDIVHKIDPDADIILYGSRAKSRSKRYSDWDILILLNRKTIPFDHEKQLLNEFFDVEIETGQVISPLIFPKAEWIKKHSLTPLFENIKQEGIKIS
jgi:predicted nucleotidyltransferase